MKGVVILIIEKQKSELAKRQRRNVSDKVTLNIPLRSFTILCRYTLTISPYIRMTHLNNLRKFMVIIDPSVYENDPNKKHRVEFIKKALEARLKYSLTDVNMILDHVLSGLDFVPDFIDVEHVDKFILNSAETKWANGMIEYNLKYAFAYKAAPQFLDVCTSITKSDYDGRGNLLERFEDLVNDTHNKFRKSEVSTNNIDMVFSLRNGQFEEAVSETYDMLTNPSRKLICGMQGLNEMINGGFESGRVYMLLGITNVGKSVTLLNLMYQLKKYNTHYKPKDPSKTPCIVMLTMENSVIETIDRLFDMITTSSGMENYTKEEVIRKLREEGDLKLTDESPIDMIIKYKPNRSVDTSYLYDMCEDFEDDGYEVICVIQDHVKRIRSAEYTPDIRLELGNVVNEFKSFALEKDIPFITVSHLNRDAARSVEQDKARATPTDITMQLGMSNVGESFLMLDNLDVGIIINLDYDDEGNKYMVFNMTKKRVKTDLTYIAQPFVYGSSIRLLEDIGTPPMYKTYLHMNKTIGGRKPSIRTTSSNVMASINDVISSSHNQDNTFSDNVQSTSYFDGPMTSVDDEVDKDLDTMDDTSVPEITKPTVVQPVFFMNKSNNKLDLNDLEEIREVLGSRK